MPSLILNPKKYRVSVRKITESVWKATVVRRDDAEHIVSWCSESAISAVSSLATLVKDKITKNEGMVLNSWDLAIAEWSAELETAMKKLRREMEGGWW